MRIPDNQLRVRYPKNIGSLYQEDFERRKKHCIGGKCQVLNRDKEKKTFKADPISMKTTKQVDFTGEQVPYERVKQSRPVTSYGPFISSTSYGNTFQKWQTDPYVPTLKPKDNLTSTTRMPFRAASAYRDTYKTASQPRPSTGKSGVNDPNNALGGKNRAQKSQISILSSPGNNKTPFMKDTTNRVEFRGQKSMERPRPIRHKDNLGNTDLKVDPQLYKTSYRSNFDKIQEPGMCNREVERVNVRREIKQLQ